MKDFIATRVMIKNSHHQVDREPVLNSVTNHYINLTIELDLTSVSDLSKYIKEDQTVNESLIAEDILNGKIKIV